MSNLQKQVKELAVMINSNPEGVVPDEMIVKILIGEIAKEKSMGEAIADLVNARGAHNKEAKEFGGDEFSPYETERPEKEKNKS